MSSMRPELDAALWGEKGVLHAALAITEGIAQLVCAKVHIWRLPHVPMPAAENRTPGMECVAARVSMCVAVFTEKKWTRKETKDLLKCSIPPEKHAPRETLRWRRCRFCTQAKQDGWFAQSKPAQKPGSARPETPAAPSLAERPVKI